MTNTSVSPRGRRRGRGRGRGRPPTRARDVGHVKFEDDSSMFGDHDEIPLGQPEGAEKENTNQTVDPSSMSLVSGAATTANETKLEKCSAWPLPDGVGDIGFEPSRLVQLNMQVDEDEDYDNED